VRKGDVITTHILPTKMAVQIRTHSREVVRLHNELQLFSCRAMGDVNILSAIMAAELVARSVGKQLVCLAPQFGPVEGFYVFPTLSENIRMIPGYRPTSIEEQRMVYVVSYSEYINKSVTTCMSMNLLATLDDVDTTRNKMVTELISGGYKDVFFMRVLSDGTWMLRHGLV